MQMDTLVVPISKENDESSSVVQLSNTWTVDWAYNNCMPCTCNLAKWNKLITCKRNIVINDFFR